MLIDAEVAPPTQLPPDDAELDLVVLDDAASQFASLDAATQTAIVREVVRVLQPGGRILVISALPAEGLAALLGRGSKGPPTTPRLSSKPAAAASSASSANARASGSWRGRKVASRLVAGHESRRAADCLGDLADLRPADLD